MFQRIMWLINARATRSICLAMALALPFLTTATGCGDSAGSGQKTVKDPAPAPPDELSSDNMPNSAKNKAKFPK